MTQSGHALDDPRACALALARSLRRRQPKGGQLSLRGVSKELAARGFFNELGKPYAAKSVASMRGSSELRRLTYHRHKHR